MEAKRMENVIANKSCCTRPLQRRYVSLGVQCVVTMVIALSISLYPPFYPKLAQSKGASATVYGFVLGSNCLTAFLVTPFVGRNVIGPRFAYISGIFINGVCCALTGFLDVVPSGYQFVSLSIAIRVISAIGNAGVITASFSFIANDFPQTIAQVFALNRLVMNMGQLAGPALGGALLEFGGFRLPFVILGCAEVFAALFSICFLPKSEEKADNSPSKSSNQKELTIWNVFKIPSIYIAFSVFLMSTMANGFLSITLEPQVLRQYAMHGFYMGLIFGIKDGTSSLANPFWGWLCDKPRAVKPCIIICCLIVITAFIFLGPFSGNLIQQSLWVPCFALSLNGIGIAGLQVSGIIDAFHEVIDAGYPDDPMTHGCVAGLWSSVSGLGRFVARTFAGILIDHVGFELSTVVICGLMVWVVLITSVFLCVKHSHRQRGSSFLYQKDKHVSFSNTTDVTSSKLLKSYEFNLSRNYIEGL